MATGLVQIQSGIYSAFGAAQPNGWNFSTWPVVSENSKWIEAKHGAPAQPTTEAWGRICVRFADSMNASVDGKLKRVTGILWLQIFVPEAGGSIVAAAMGDELERVFGRRTLTSSGEVIRFERAITRYVGKTDSGWEQHACTIDFMADAVTP